MERIIPPWLIDVLLRHVAPRLAVALLGALAAFLADVGLLDGQLHDAVRLALGL